MKIERIIIIVAIFWLVSLSLIGAFKFAWGVLESWEYTKSQQIMFQYGEGHCTSTTYGTHYAINCEN